MNPTKNRGELGCNERASSSCPITSTRRVNLVTNSVISHEWGKDMEVFTTSGTYPCKIVYACHMFCTFSFGHCVVCSSLIYGFWLPLWYLQTLLTHTFCSSALIFQTPRTVSNGSSQFIIYYLHDSNHRVKYSGAS